MLQLNEQNRIPELDHCYICGELALSGECGRGGGSGWVIGLWSDQSLRGRAILAWRERTRRCAYPTLESAQNSGGIRLL
jgi:hypothetical protein